MAESSLQFDYGMWHQCIISASAPIVPRAKKIGDHQHRNAHRTAFIASLRQAAVPVRLYFFPLLFPSTFSLTLRKLTETQGNSIPHLQKASKVLNYPTRQRFHRQTFQHTPVKSVSPRRLCFRAPLCGRFRQMAPKRSRRHKGDAHVVAQPKRRTCFV